MSELRKRIPLDKNLSISDIVRNKGYYDIDGNWNSILTSDQYPGMLFRGRVEVFIFDKYNNVYMNIRNGHYRIPGGSWDHNRSHKYQVEQEAKEEARVVLGKITYTGYSYYNFFKKKYLSSPVHWDGSYNEVYIGYFKKWYTGYIKKCVRDFDMDKNGRFVPFEYAANILTPNHQIALGLIPKP